MHFLKQLHSLLAPVGHAALNLVYPRTCRICRVPLPGDGERQWFCERCEREFATVEAPYCNVCAEPYEGAIDHEFRCQNCADRKLAFEFAFARYRAEGEVRNLIHRFKYNGDLSLRAALGDLLLRALEEPRLAQEDLTQWLVVPVPLHPSRRRERGFNQAAYLTRHLAKERGLVPVDALKRIRPTNKQADLTRAQRLENLRNAFAVKRRFRGETSPLKGANIVLVDDVFTTGATTDACARVLQREGGAKKVVVIAVARG